MRNEIMFVELVVVAGCRKRLPSDALVQAAPILETVLRISGMLAVEEVRGARAELGVSRGRRHVGAERAGRVRSSGSERGANHGVEIFFSAIEGDEEAAVGGMRNWARDATFVDAALLEGL